MDAIIDTHRPGIRGRIGEVSDSTRLRPVACIGAGTTPDVWRRGDVPGEMVAFTVLYKNA